MIYDRRGKIYYVIIHHDRHGELGPIDYGREE